MTDLTINPKFESLIPKLTDDEFRQLEENILKDGITEPLVVWNGVLIDGHNRYKLAKKHNLGFEIREVSFDNENDAEIWIIKNQFGRRNLSKYDRSVLALRLKPKIAEQAKENNKTHSEQGYQKSDKAVHTSKELAKLAGVSHDTIHKVEVIEQKASDDLKQKLRSGEKSINEAYIAVAPKPKSHKEIAKEAREQHDEFRKAVKESKSVSFQDAREDERNIRIIGEQFYSEIQNAMKPIQKIAFLKDKTDVEALLKVLDSNKKEWLLEDIEDTIRRLQYIRKVVTGS